MPSPNPGASKASGFLPLEYTLQCVLTAGLDAGYPFPAMPWPFSLCFKIQSSLTSWLSTPAPDTLQHSARAHPCPLWLVPTLVPSAARQRIVTSNVHRLRASAQGRAHSQCIYSVLGGIGDQSQHLMFPFLPPAPRAAGRLAGSPGRGRVLSV